MRIAIALASRNIRVFLRDRVALFFTFLSVIIIIVLYSLFLGDNMVSILSKHIPDIKVAKAFTDTWILAGVLVVNSVTSTLGALEVMVADQERGIEKDFLVSPIRRWQLLAGYLMSTWAVGAFMGVLVFLCSQAYFFIRGDGLIGLSGSIKIIGAIMVNVFSFSAFNFLAVSFFKSSAAFSTFSTLLGTMVGFLTGVYVPLGILPGFIQKLMLLIPATHGASVMRGLFMAEPLEHMYSHVTPEIAREFTGIYGIILRYGETQLKAPLMVSYIFLSGVVLLVISIALLMRKKLR